MRGHHLARIRLTCLLLGCTLSAATWATVPSTVSALGVVERPTLLIATETKPGPGVSLTWSDNSSDEAGFTVWRAVGEAYTGGAYSKIATVGPDVTSFEDPSIQWNYTYRYRVHVYGSAPFPMQDYAYANTAITPTSPDYWIWRFRDTRSGAHFYTAGANERADLLARADAYVCEGPTFPSFGYSYAHYALPLYRFYDTWNGTHFYTVGEDERAVVISLYGYRYVYEGVATKVLPEPPALLWVPEAPGPPSPCRPVHRFYDHKREIHFFTADPAEKDTLTAAGSPWSYEGIAFYVPK